LIGSKGASGVNLRGGLLENQSPAALEASALAFASEVFSQPLMIDADASAKPAGRWLIKISADALPVAATKASAETVSIVSGVVFILFGILSAGFSSRWRSPLPLRAGPLREPPRESRLAVRRPK
jgi:hypothetical protein